MACAARPLLLRAGLSLRAPRWCRPVSGLVVAPSELDAGPGRHGLCAHSGDSGRYVRHFQVVTGPHAPIRRTELRDIPISPLDPPTAQSSAPSRVSEYLGPRARVMHALQHSGLEAALRAYTEAPSGTVLLRPAGLRLMMSHLSGMTHQKLPSASDVALCATIAREQLAAHLPRPDHVSSARLPLQTAGMLVLQALGSRAAIPDRREHMDALLDLLQRGRFLILLEDILREHYALIRGPRDLRPVIRACFRSASHAEAIDALSGLRNLSEGDYTVAVEALTSLKLQDHAFMPVEHFARVLDLNRKLEVPVTSRLFVAYFDGLAIALKVARQPEEHADIEAVEHGVYNAARAAERMLRAHIPLLVIPGYAALLRLYLCLGPSAVHDVRRCWQIVRCDRQTAARILREPFPLDATCELWEDFLTMLREPTKADWNAFSRALRAGGTYASLVREVVDCVGDDLALRLIGRDLDRCVEKVLAHTSLPADRARQILSYISRSQLRVPFLIPRKTV